MEWGWQVKGNIRIDKKRYSEELSPKASEASEKGNARDNYTPNENVNMEWTKQLNYLDFAEDSALLSYNYQQM